MGKRILFIALLIGITFNLKAEGYRISVKWEGLMDTSVYLAHYFDTKIYINDTVRLDNKGKGVFSGEKKLHEGLYVLYLNEKTYFDFLLGTDQDLVISTDNSDLLKSLKIEKAEESELFLKYQGLLKEKGAEKKELDALYQKSDDSAKHEIQKKIDGIDQQVEGYITSGSEKFPGTMYSLFLKMSDPVKVPDPGYKKGEPQYDSLVWFYYYNFNRDHFLDHIDFSDDRILYTPLLTQKLDTYFNRTLLQTPDSIIPYAFRVINRAKKNPTVFQYVTQYLLNSSLQSKVMGMDALFVSVADSIYLKGKATWADTTTLNKIAKEAYLSRFNLIGKKAPEFVVQNIDDEYESLYQLQGNYTVLVFWEPSCGHCKKEIPELYQKVYLKYLDQNIDYFAVNIDDDKKEWTDFVEKNQLLGWHHVWDPTNQSMCRVKYNVQNTPLIYLLDKDKKIIAKRIDSATLIKLLDTLLKK